MPTMFGRRVTVNLYFWEDADGFGMSEEELWAKAREAFPNGQIGLTFRFDEAEVTEDGAEWQVQNGSRWG